VAVLRHSPDLTVRTSRGHGQPLVGHRRRRAGIDGTVGTGGLGPQSARHVRCSGEWVTGPGCRGSPFINAAEFPDQGPVAEQVAARRTRVRETVSALTGGTGRDPGLLIVIITLYDGAMSAACLDRDPSVVGHARHAAEELLRRQGGV
jgi:hypothetical protein